MVFQNVAIANSDNGEEIVEKSQELSEEQQKLDQSIIDQFESFNISKKDKKQMIATLSMYSGPVPTPALLEGYENLDKGAAKKNN